MNDLGLLYVFPAQPISWSYQINTFKAAQVAYYGKSKQFGDKGAEKNYPINYGRAKELAVGSLYHTYVIAPENINFRRWIRLGKWASKIHVQVISIPNSVMEVKSGEYSCLHPLNPLDLPNQTKLMLYNRVVMPPVSLVSQSQLNGEYWENTNKNNVWDNFKSQLPEIESRQLPAKIRLPLGASYGIRNIIPST